MLLQSNVAPTMAAVFATWNIKFFTRPDVWLCCAVRAYDLRTPGVHMAYAQRVAGVESGKTPTYGVVPADMTRPASLGISEI